ncbi:Uncharacterized conserved protein, DUF2147 family [Salinihabitans flavidus]|uniref:Uncharacterized conserved protein, DUF2147 family n=1 Tax=Salinihabitans flavidus TaxID=569882 RepID=A0A1H8LG33_9RHOB|nr:DUF2147 domain-containing protein [Salinihabitans flavidus]SEO04162.1 Uncharacterized conserved protein, DUF2147 family [Salinihabitans flavidus]
MNMNSLRKIGAALAAAVTFSVVAGAGAAQTPLGVWLTPPDRKGQVAHVETERCGDAYCGSIVRAFDSDGEPVMTPNVGKRVFWDLTKIEGNTYGGMAWVPAHDRTYNAKMTVKGDELTVKGCVLMICQSQVWKRVQ